MAIIVEQRLPESVRRRLAMSLVGVERADDATLHSEVMRRAIWALTTSGVETHVARALNFALDAVAPLHRGIDQSVTRRELRNALDELGQVGDLVELSGGYWYPAAVREVDLEETNDVLIVGGVPTSALPPHVKPHVSSRRAFRRVPRGLAVAALGADVETLSTWLGRPTTSLIEWGREILQADIPETTDPPELRYYVAEGKPAKLPQRHRWQDKAPPGVGRFLADFTGLFGVRQYRIVEVRDGRTCRLGAVLMPGESRRLMYAVDALAKNPVSVGLREDGTHMVLSLRSELPGAELRLLGALGTLHTPSDHYYPREWRFPRERESLVRGALSGLHVLIPND